MTWMDRGSRLLICMVRALSADARLSHNGDLRDNRVVIVVYSFCPYFEYMDVICHCLKSTLRVTNYQQAG